MYLNAGEVKINQNELWVKSKTECDTCKMSTMLESSTKLMTAPVIIITRIVFWMSGGRINLSFGQTRIPDDVAFAVRLSHSPSTQEMLTEFLIGIVGSVIVKRQRESIPKEKMLTQRLEGTPLEASPIIVQPRTRRLHLKKVDDVFVWHWNLLRVCYMRIVRLLYGNIFYSCSFVLQLNKFGINEKVKCSL